VMLCVLVTMFVLVCFYDTSVVFHSNLVFCEVTITGCLLGLATITTYIGDLSELQCALRPWFAGLAWFFVFSPLLAKLYRLTRILSNAAMLGVSISNVELMCYAGVLVLIELVLLIVWTIRDPLRPTHLDSDVPNHSVVVCTCSSLWLFLGLQLAYIVLTLLVGVAFSIRLRNVASRVMLQEPLWIAFVMYSSPFWLLLFGLATGFLWKNWLAGFLLANLALLGLIITVFALLFGLKLYLLFATKDGTSSVIDSAQTNSMVSTTFRADVGGEDESSWRLTL